MPRLKCKQTSVAAEAGGWIITLHTQRVAALLSLPPPRVTVTPWLSSSETGRNPLRSSTWSACEFDKYLVTNETSFPELYQK